MSVAQNLDQEISEVGQKAFEALCEMAIPPEPPYYQVWFSHLRKDNRALSREIDQKLSAGKPIDEVFLTNIHGKYFPPTDSAICIDDYAAQLLNQSQNLGDFASELSASANAFDEDLNQAAREHEYDPNKLLSTLLHTAKGALERNAELEDNLAKASTKIETLKEAIELIATDANTDFLTKLHNRRYFESVLARLIEESESNKTPLCLIVTDIDHFKNFNDTWGHQVGDQVLKLVAATLRENVKGQDLLARYGGEEFVITLPYTSLKDAHKLADNIRIAIAKRLLINKSNNEELGRITMSFGVTQHETGVAMTELFERADAALYAAKKGGRNMVMNFSKR